MQATQTKMYVTTDIISHSKGTKYASQGDLVTVLDYLPVHSGELVICQKGDEKFHVPADKLSVDFVAREVIIKGKRK